MIFPDVGKLSFMGLLALVFSCGSVNARPLDSQPRGMAVPASFFPNSSIPATYPTLQKRGNGAVSGQTICRSVTNADLATLSDAQLQVLINNANKMFDKPLVTLSNVRVYRQQMFYGRTGGGFNGYISALRNVDITDYSQDGASICLDGVNSKLAYNKDATCSTNHIKSYGTLNSAGGLVTVGVTQGYLVDSTVSSQTTNGQNWDVSKETSNSNQKTKVDIDTNELGGAVTTTVDFVVEVAVEIAYSHVFERGTETTTGSGSSTTNSNGGDTSTSSGTITMNEQNFLNTVSVQISPPAGYTCYIDVAMSTCKGSAAVTTPVIMPSGMLLVYFPNGACLNPAVDPTCSQGNNQYWYVPVTTLLNGYTPSYVTDTVDLQITANGQYSEKCDAGTNGTLPGSTGNNNFVSTTYVPTLNCPANLAVKKGCSASMDDYLGSKVVSGDTSVWAKNGVSYTQSPGPGANISFGQQQVTFNASTPYQSTVCTGLLQVVPPFSASFVPAMTTLQYPNDGSSLKGAAYTVGYVSTCDDTQYGTCAITNIKSQNAPNFSWSRTSNKGSPNSIYTFGNGGQAWPETDVLAFSITCTDVYGNTGGIESYQQVVRGDVLTKTLTAQTSTYTLQSATRYLYTSVATLYTSMVTPVITSTLLTQTIYTATSYTGTKTVTKIGATYHPGRATTVTKSATTTLPVTTATSIVTVLPSNATTTVIKTVTRASTVLTTVTPTTTVFTTPTSTVKKTVTVQPTNCAASKRAIVTTTTTTDTSATYTATDFTNTNTVTNSGTTTSTDKDDWATATVKSTQVLYDPKGTAYVTTIDYEVKTSVVNNFTVYRRTSTVTNFSTQTPSVTKTKTTTTTLAPVTASARSTVLGKEVKSSTVTAPASTVTKALKNKTTKTVTSTATVTAACK